MYIRFLKSELYRASKLKCTYILLIVLLALSMIMNFVLLKFDFLGQLGIDSQMFMELGEGGNSMEGVNDAAQIGSYMSNQIVVEGEKERTIIGEGLFYKSDVPQLFYVHVSDLDTIMLLAIFVGIFVGDIMSTGINKNLIISNNKLSTLYLARVTVIALYALIMQIFTWLFAVLGAALWAESVIFNFGKTFFVYFFVTYFLSLVFSLLVYAITLVTRSKAAGITIGVVLSTGALTLIISIANWAIITKFGLESDFSVANYMLTENMGSFALDYTNGELVRALVVGVVYAVIAVGAVLITNKKRDLA